MNKAEHWLRQDGCPHEDKRGIKELMRNETPTRGDNRQSCVTALPGAVRLRRLEEVLEHLYIHVRIQTQASVPGCHSLLTSARAKNNRKFYEA